MFERLKAKVQERFAIIQSNGPILTTAVDRDKIWDIYLGNIPDDLRPSNVCNCCKSFLRQFGGVVGVGPDNTITTLWDFSLDHDEDDHEYGKAVTALRRYVASLPIHGPFYTPGKNCGTDKNLDGVRRVWWNHLYFEAPRANIKPESDIPSLIGDLREKHGVFLRSIREITPNAVDVVLELIGQNSLYRGSEFQPVVEKFRTLQRAALKVPADLQGNHCWKALCNSKPGAEYTIRNTAIGTLLTDLSEGKSLDAAVGAFERIVAPTNYKRPTALVTPRMVDEAKARIEELGLLPSLERRLLNDRDLTANNALFTFRRRGQQNDVFSQIKSDTPINPKTLSKVEEIGIEDFLHNIQFTTSVKALMENSHLGNLVSLVGPANPDAPSMFKWNNGFSWSYTGGVADSIKERVKSAGGNVTGKLRISLSWSNSDDLDLHVIDPRGTETFYGNKGPSPSGCQLDVDMNAYTISKDPVENIYWDADPRVEGTYEVVVNQFNRRDTKRENDGFDVEIEYDGQVYHYHSPTNGTSKKNHRVCEFRFTKKDGFSMSSLDGGSATGYSSQEKWGLKTGLFHHVKAIVLSPNHWDTAVGNKHFFFLLEGAKNDERVRPFYNEFLKPELDKDRKVFEILGSRIDVASVDNELSGLGFSDTVRNHLFVEVEGAFKRTLKVKF